MCILLWTNRKFSINHRILQWAMIENDHIQYVTAFTRISRERELATINIGHCWSPMCVDQVPSPMTSIKRYSFQGRLNNVTKWRSSIGK